jgi:putative ABC transport system substrate-binding protein
MHFRQWKRREFITLLGGVTAWPVAARTQQRPKMLRVGTVQALPRDRSTWRAFERRIGELGYVEGENLTVDFIELKDPVDLRLDLERYGEGLNQLLRREVDVIVAVGNEMSLKAAMTASNTVPIIMIAIEFDPIALGYVTSLARPTGNVTGVVFQQIELSVKRLQILKDAFPDRQTVTAFWDARSADQWQAAQKAAPS